MENNNSCALLSILILFFFLCFDPANAGGGALTQINVVKLGARPDGRTDCAQTFVRAWATACASAFPAQIYVPPGRYLVATPLLFTGHSCRNRATTFRIDGTLVGPANYRALGSVGSWITFEAVAGVSLLGGTLEAQGSAVWACKKSGKASSCPGATSLEFSNSEEILISGLASVNSQMFHIVIHQCRNVKVQRVRVTAPGDSPNTDGIHVELSTGVTISGATISTGDDCVSVGPGTSNLWIENVACGPGHGISIGSLGKELKEPGVQNVTVKTVTFTGTENGVRIKSWGRPSTGFVRNVIFQQATMSNVQNPIVIDQNYCPSHQNCPSQVSGIKISNVIYENIHGTSATEVAVKFDCSPKSPCSGIRMENVKLTYQNRPAVASCVNAGGIALGLVEPKTCL
ncbi:polygalacturonase-like [Malania oleifera]|uniref:polygalacturonase-like n=1 Tax=Malania oleifera TaxID=397392 RepID=UPI0025AE09DF|nr:polygalacturonase-like [Malania oleifera]